LNRRELGAAGERAAERALVKKGGRVLARNYRTRFGEIDLIVGFRDLIAFVEVKTRTNAAFGAPSEAVDSRKQARIAKTAMQYLHQTAGGGARVRFDVVEVLDGRVRHIEGAFDVFDSKYS
jgi:putative endonuclease